MSSLVVVLWLTFVESVSTILVERGIYFYTREVLGYSDRINLFIALGLGLVYIAGARSSHTWTKRFGEKKVLRACMFSQLLLHGLMWIWPSGPVLVVSIILIGLVCGVKWPVIESYVSAGREAREASRAIGRFNISWSIGVPVALALTGPIISVMPRGLFPLAVMLNVLGLLFLHRLPPQPVHLEGGHVEANPDGERPRYQALLVSSRWSMLNSYALLFLLAPLMPGIFARLGLSVVVATLLASVMDLLRVTTFWLMGRYTGWHGKRWPVVAALVGLPVGFFLIYLEPGLGAILLGECFFGLAAGLSYFAALYYAMVLHNASVEAGGEHEGLIGTGFAVGPGLGLAGKALSAAGTALSAVPACGFILLCVIRAGRPLLQEAREKR